MTDTTTGSTGPARELPLAPDGAIEIHLAAGDLRLRGTDGDRVVIRSRDGEPLGERVAVDAEPGLVRVRDGIVNLKLGPLSVRAHRSPDLDIDLPRTARITLRTMSGDVEATGIAGSSRWASASGDLRISTSSGPVQLETMSGDATLEASGAIDLGARTVSGDLRVRAPRLDTLDVGTTSGDIRLEGDLAAGARHEVSSVSGDVEIVTSSPVRLDAQTITGDVRANGDHRAEGGRGRRSLIVGDGSVMLSVRTTSGDVRLRASAGPVRSETGTAAPKHGWTVPEPPVPPVPPVAPLSPDAPAAPVPPVPAFSFAEPDVARDVARDLAGDRVADLEPVAEATAGPIRPITDEDTQAWSAPTPVVDRREAARLDILRALERGELDIEAASHRLEILDDAGPRSFREWC